MEPVNLDFTISVVLDKLANPLPPTDFILTGAGVMSAAQVQSDELNRAVKISKGAPWQMLSR